MTTVIAWVLGDTLVLGCLHDTKQLKPLKTGFKMQAVLVGV